METHSKTRMAFLTWIVVYPLITALIMILEPVLAHLALPVRTLILTGIMVPIMVFLAMPLATARLSAWLALPPRAGERKEERAGEREGDGHGGDALAERRIHDSKSAHDSVWMGRRGTPGWSVVFGRVLSGLM
ncbi:MAG: hypothetical protein AAGE89_05070 [Pseudomonadota bacterium]